MVALLANGVKLIDIRVLRMAKGYSFGLQGFWVGYRGRLRSTRVALVTIGVRCEPSGWL